MKRLSLLIACSLAFSIGVNAQNKKQQDQKAIKSMCGCYEVSFNFAETFQYSKDSTYLPSKVKHDKGLEWVQLVEDTNDKIMLQHLLIVGSKESPYIVKHWRQDWEYQNTDLYEFDHDNKWKYVSLPKNKVAGQWSQKVFQVDDSPRYEGTASWVHVDGKSYWENTTDAPLPRREYTTRSDYNVTTRTNRHEIIANGWIHEQDNNKVIREEGKEDVLLAQEKGYNTYVKVDDNNCKAAQDYWKTNENKWVIVRAKWDEVFARNKKISLRDKVEEKALYEYLFSNDFSPTEKNVDQTVERFIIK
tara:strand:+ start:231287 stop:232195 length:909 start_codon:yes stop_codon:yes gene_type:complete